MTKHRILKKSKFQPRVVALVYDGLCTFEYGIVVEVFGLSRPELGGDLYHFNSVSLEKNPIHAAGGLIVNASGTCSDLENADIVVIPGWRGKDEEVARNICKEIRAAHLRGARLLSICSGAYVLAAAGLLNARNATTHWRYVEDFQTRYPEVNVRPNELYVDEGDIITSAGSSAGIDACLHIVRQDHGAKIANSVARRLVMHSHRQGGQAQYIEQPQPKIGRDHRLSKLMDDIRDRIAETHDIASMARQVNMSTRTFQRRFQALTGLSAMQWLTQERVSQSCVLLESTDISVEAISHAIGFGNSESMRYHFRRTLDVSPLEYRKRFSNSPATASKVA